MLRVTIGMFATIALATPAAAQSGYTDVLDRISLPEGFRISVFAEVPGARSVVRDPGSGVIFIGSRSDTIHALADRDGDGRAETVTEIASGLHVPNGLAIQDGELFIALQDQVVSWPIPKNYDGKTPISSLQPVASGFQDSSHHGWRYAGFDPRGRLHVALGAPCNICELKPNTGKIVRLAADGSSWEVVADGVRNSVGFDWSPVTGELWFTDNGADRMGDDIPPDELNRVTHQSQHFGFPYRGGKGIPLTGYENVAPPFNTVSPEVAFQAHTANLGIDFYQGDMFPPSYKNDAFVAQHGSWNRSEPVGYRLMRIRFDTAGNATDKEVFADGWLASDGTVYGRPVDMEELPDGSLLVSDDHAGLIYRITYEK